MAAGLMGVEVGVDNAVADESFIVGVVAVVVAVTVVAGAVVGEAASVVVTGLRASEGVPGEAVSGPPSVAFGDGVRDGAWVAVGSDASVSPSVDRHQTPSQALQFCWV